MIEITEYAYQILFEVLSSNLDKSTNYGSPPIFDWFCRVLDETRNIESFRYSRKGEYKYKLAYSLGIAHVICDYLGRKRILIVTDYEINKKVLFSWKNRSNNGGMMPKEKPSKPKKPYKRITKKPFFGYTFVMNDNKEYNLLTKDGKLLTQWFRAIKPINQSKPFGEYQIIAYINVAGMFCALGYDGKVYNLGKSWREMYTENRNILNTQLFMNITTENIDNVMKTNKKVVRLSESKLRNIISEAVKNVLNEIGDTHRGQYMIGRASARADRNGRYDSLAPNYHNGKWNPNGDFEQGYDNQCEYEDAKKRGEFYPSTTRLTNGYKWRETADNDEQQSNFINWMENDRNNPLENAVAYLQGDKSEFGNLINMYEDYLGYELSPKSIANIKKALNHWWFYAESQFEID